MNQIVIDIFLVLGGFLVGWALTTILKNKKQIDADDEQTETEKEAEERLNSEDKSGMEDKEYRKYLKEAEEEEMKTMEKIARDEEVSSRDKEAIIKMEETVQ